MHSELGKRDSFASKYGIIVAAAGSAAGLGNIWKFPYIVSEANHYPIFSFIVNFIAPFTIATIFIYSIFWEGLG